MTDTKNTNRNVYQYPSSFSDSMISFEYENDACWIDKYYIDEDNIKMFFVLLKDSIEKMKKSGYKKFLQLVSNDDWEIFLSKDDIWKIEKEHSDRTKTIMCDINDAPRGIARGFGLSI